MRITHSTGIVLDVAVVVAITVRTTNKVQTKTMTMVQTQTGIIRALFNYKLFIGNARKHECIWNRDHGEYKNKELRRLTWLDILKGMDEEEEDRWRKNNFEQYHAHGK